MSPQAAFPRFFILLFGLVLTFLLILASCSDGGSSDTPTDLPMTEDVDQDDTGDDAASEPVDNDRQELEDSPVTDMDLVTGDGANLAPVADVWENAGASPELASCYREALESAGIANVTDLNELAEAQGNLTDTQTADLEACYLTQP